MSRLTLTYKDFSREKSTVEMLLAEPAAGGANLDAVVASAAAVVAAIEDVSVCILAKESISFNETVEVGDAPAGAFRELGLRVFWSDTTAETMGHFTIPGPDPTGAWNQVGTDEVNYSDADIAALIVVLEANVLSPDGNPIEIGKIVTVGRRN